jgi:hypothetical protein
MIALMVGPSVPLYLWHPDVEFQPLLTIVSFFLRHKVHDWLILIDREVEHIWRKEWSIPKILFIISRYGLLLDMPMTIACEPNFILVYRWGAGNAHFFAVL